MHRRNEENMFQYMQPVLFIFVKDAQNNCGWTDWQDFEAILETRGTEKKAEARNIAIRNQPANSIKADSRL